MIVRRGYDDPLISIIIPYYIIYTRTRPTENGTGGRDANKQPFEIPLKPLKSCAVGPRDTFFLYI